MMSTAVEILILGIVQGLTEFLPISSSGHLAILADFFGLRENSLTISVLLHFSTLLAVVLFFRKDIVKIFQSTRRLAMLIIACLPTAVIGFWLSATVRDVFEVNVGMVYFFLFVSGLLIFLADRVKIDQTIDDWNYMSWAKAFVIGIAQGIAVLPGISRSGATISAGIFSGLTRTSAAKFSFLVSLPAITGATLLEAKDAKLTELSSIGIYPVVISMVAAFLSGIFALWFLFKIIKTPDFRYFAYYLWAISILGIMKQIL